MATIDEIYEVENWVESSVIAALSDIAGVTFFYGREVDLSVSPRIEVKAINGAETGRSTPFVPRMVESTEVTPFLKSAWSCDLEIMLVTNRQDEVSNNPKLHTVLLGKIRRRMQLFYLAGPWQATQRVIALGGVQDRGTQDSYSDTDNLDYSKLKWLLTVGVNTNAWPVI